MKLQTKHIGEVEINREEWITFAHGLPAFEEETEFVLLPFDDEKLFYMLQSVHTPEVAFIVVNPFPFFQGYEVKLTDQVVEQLAIENESDVAIFSILTVQEPFKNTTANLQAPIVINMKEKKGKQFVMSDSPYETKHYLFPKTAAAVRKGAR
ncbi:flagellar assembly protein FliW [Bacillus piscicola]|uniref:flagellar assembly protein FliW n=1 Tax=Bacillus piscicola TaxID=1632684 RepID=UPI001F0963F1